MGVQKQGCWYELGILGVLTCTRCVGCYWALGDHSTCSRSLGTYLPRYMPLVHFSVSRISALTGLIVVLGLKP